MKQHEDLVTEDLELGNEAEEELIAMAKDIIKEMSDRQRRMFKKEYEADVLREKRLKLSELFP